MHKAETDVLKNNKHLTLTEASKHQFLKHFVKLAACSCGHTGVFRRVNGEGLAYDQMFCRSDVWVGRPSAVLTSVVLTSVVESWYG